jgi:hypothetical protein
MKQLSMLALAALATLALTRSTAWAGSPHFVSCSVVPSDTPNTLSVNGKEAGLGNEEQVDIVLTATALCINNGGKHPRAVNKEDVSAAETFPVQNGKADFTINVTATFQPDCVPPMTVEFTDISVCDTTNDICCTL